MMTFGHIRIGQQIGVANGVQGWRMPDWKYREHFRFMGGTPGKGQGSLWECCYCLKLCHASWGHAAKHFWKCQRSWSAAHKMLDNARLEEDEV